jgi:hypothetical protein
MERHALVSPSGPMRAQPPRTGLSNNAGCVECTFQYIRGDSSVRRQYQHETDRRGPSVLEATQRQPQIPSNQVANAVTTLPQREFRTAMAPSSPAPESLLASLDFSSLSVSPKIAPQTHHHSPLPPIQSPLKSPNCSKEQNLVLSLVAQGENVFFTGSAGVGKSFVLRKIRDFFKSSGRKEFQDFFVTASTGTRTFFCLAKYFRDRGCTNRRHDITFICRLRFSRGWNYRFEETCRSNSKSKGKLGKLQNADY